MPTNMTIPKSSKYSCLRICNVDNAKIINWICTCSELIFQPESNKHRTKTGNQKHTVQKREIKTNWIVHSQQNHKNKWKKTEKYVETTYLIRIEGKTTRRVDFVSKMTINHPSSIYKKKKGPMAKIWVREKRDKVQYSFNTS